jgi:hypothetical protein
MKERYKDTSVCKERKKGVKMKTLGYEGLMPEFWSEKNHSFLGYDTVNTLWCY